MFGWLRDALTSAPTSFGYHHPITPSSLFRQQKQKQKQPEHHSSDDEEINQSIDHSFYHNPYHSSGQMNYVDVPQQQYTNEHNYPTYLARQQTSDAINQTLDEQIHEKLLTLKQRSSQFQCYAHRQNNYAYRNRTIPVNSTPRPSFISNRIEHRKSNTEERSDDEEEDDEDDEDDDDDNNEEERSSSTGNYHGIPGYYSGQYSNVDEQFDLASVVLWYKNVMQSVKKFLPSGHNYIHSENEEYNKHHYSISSKNPILSRTINENNILLNNETEETNNSLSSSSKVKWIDAVKTVTQLNQVRENKKKETNVD